MELKKVKLEERISFWVLTSTTPSLLPLLSSEVQLSLLFSVSYVDHILKVIMGTFSMIHMLMEEWAIMEDLLMDLFLLEVVWEVRQ